MKILRRPLLFGLVLIALGVQAHPLERWKPRNGQSYAQTLSGIAYGNGVFVGVGSSLTTTGAFQGSFVRYATNGIVVRSTNGLDWEIRQLPGKQLINGIIHAKDCFVAVGNAGAILWSSNGNSWSNVSVPIQHNITAIGYGTPSNSPDGVFVAIATLPQDGYISDRIMTLASTDGVSWQTNRQSFFRWYTTKDAIIPSIAFGNGRFFAAWNRYGRDGLVCEDGLNWSLTSASSKGITGFGNNRFLIVVDFLLGSPASVVAASSSDGITWPLVNYSGPVVTPRGLCFDGSQFLVVGDSGYTAKSPDGTNWVVKSMPFPEMLSSVAYGNGVYVAVAAGRHVLTSTNGEAWVRTSIPPEPGLFAVAATRERCIATGADGVIAWSTGGFWDSLSSPTANTLRAVLNRPGNYLFAGEQGTILSGERLDALSLRTTGTTTTLNAVATDGTIDVVVGDAGVVLTSTNSVDWVSQTSGTTLRLASVIYANGIFVAVGDSGTVLTSDDGEIWVNRTSGTTRSFRDAVFGNGTFVAVTSFSSSSGSGPYLVTSLNGRDWLPAQNSKPSTSAIVFGNGFFVYPTYDDAVFLKCNISTDGKDWSEYTFAQPVMRHAIVNDLTYFNGRFISVGNFGAIWESDPLFNVAMDLTSGAGSLPGILSGVYRIQTSNNLGVTESSWSDVTNLTTFPYIFSDPEASNHPFRFYRAQFVE